MARIDSKICGITTTAALDAALAGGARWLGFVFFPPSPRDLAPDAAAALAARAPGHVGTVAVMVDPDDGQVAAAKASGVSAIQLHGSESPERAAAIGRATGLDIWKAVAVRTRADLTVARRYREAVARILYDAKPPAGSALPGGMGLRFDWRLLDGVAHPLPWALSGGLDADNVGEAAAITGARLVDVSSGVESAPGVKDVDKIARFLQAAGRS